MLQLVVSQPEAPAKVASKPRKRAPKRRGRKHPGVVLIKPDPKSGNWWRARIQDPDTKETKRVKLDRSLTTTELREDWARKESERLVERRRQLLAGAPRATGTSVAEAVRRFFEANPQLRARTLDAYRGATAKLEGWALQEGLKSVDHLDGPALGRFRDRLASERKRLPTKGVKRGQRLPTKELRSPHSVNRELRAVRTVLGWMRRRGLLPKLSRDDLTEQLERVATTSERIEFLKAAECVALLGAALKHDAERFAETRKEHAGEGEKGTTPRYEAVAPLTAFLLLTGMRYGEAIDLEWDQVDLDARGDAGFTSGEILLRGAKVKTGKARSVDLEITPSVRLLLALMRQRSGGDGKVFAVTRGHADAAAKRMRADGAPAFSWQMLRRTCGTFLTNAPGIFGGASAYQSAKRLGHSVTVAEKHYLGVVKGISRDARTLESAMGIGDVMSRLLRSL